MTPKSQGYNIDGGDKKFASDINVLVSEVGGMFGQAMITFNHQVASQISYTSRAQAEVAEVIVFAIQAEQAVWRTARTNLMKTAESAITAFEHGYPGGHGGGGLPGWLSMAAAITGALTLVASGGALTALGAFSTAVGSASTIMGSGGDVKPSPLDADSPQGVCDKITQALLDLNSSIAKGEHGIANGCDHARSAVKGDLATFDMARPQLLDDDNPKDFMQLDVEYAKLKDIEATTLPSIADGFRRARSSLSRAQGPVPWDRPAGFGANPYSSYGSLVGELDQLLLDVSWTVDRSAEHMRVVIEDFKKTDQQIKDALVHDTRKLQGDSGAQV
jgi:hypothetical protein